ncbi:hypothetical protein H6G36_27590 [Anabaena minutissima FACHB-250]|nr:hypothetical protein [Anabaena minutissima FACHB-250]
MAYSSNLTDAEWEIFEPLLQKILPTKKQTRWLTGQSEISSMEFSIN